MSSERRDTRFSNKDKPPKGVNAELWEILQRIEHNTEITNARLDQLEVRVDTIEDRVTNSVDEVGSDVQELKRTIARLSSQLTRNEISTHRLEDEVIKLQAHSMKGNLIFYMDSDKEIPGEDCTGVVKRFLGQKMNLPDAKSLYIPVAHRLGSKRAGPARPILAKFPIANQLANVMKFTNRLKGTRSYVVKQMPQAMNERKQFALEEFKEKTNQVQFNAKMINEKLFIKGKERTNYRRPSFHDVIARANENSEDVASSNIAEESGNSFRAFVASVTSMEEVKAARDKILEIPEVTKATHAIYAYRLKDGPENFDSDGDYGMGLALLKSLRSADRGDVFCIVTRVSSRDHERLGRKRFEIIDKVCLQALETRERN